MSTILEITIQSISDTLYNIVYNSSPTQMHIRVAHI